MARDHRGQPVSEGGQDRSLNLGTRGQAGLNTGAGANPQAQADFNHDAEAPGANDDGSGTVLTMELARVFATERRRV